VAGGDLVAADHVAHRFGQIEQAQRVGDVRPALAHGVGNLVLGLVEVVDQPAIALRLVDRRQVGALQVLDQSKLQGVEIVEAAHDDRYLVQLRLLRCPPAPFAGDDLVGVRHAAHRAHQDRLQQAVLAHRIDQHVELLEVGARLVLAGAQMRGRHGHRRAMGGPRRGSDRRDDGSGDVIVAEQGAEAAAEAARLGRQAHEAPVNSTAGVSAAPRRRRMNSLASKM
jgi:hypothetical protein